MFTVFGAVNGGKLQVTWYLSCIQNEIEIDDNTNVDLVKYLFSHSSLPSFCQTWRHLFIYSWVTESPGGKIF